MKSIKPGRGPSKKNAVTSSGAAIFGIFWCIMAASMGAYIMIPFGLFFVGIAIYNAAYSYHNATSENRYSVVDIVDEDEESDPLNEKYGRKNTDDYFDDIDKADINNGTGSAFCPYCGVSVSTQYDFCPKCGKKLPD